MSEENTMNQDEYEQTIMAAEYIILCKGRLDNPDVQGKSLVMHLFMEHEVPISLKTQDWIANSLQDIYFDRKTEKWSYHHMGNDSTVFKDCLPQLISSDEQTRFQRLMWRTDTLTSLLSKVNGYDYDEFNKAAEASADIYYCSETKLCYVPTGGGLCSIDIAEMRKHIKLLKPYSNRLTLFNDNMYLLEDESDDELEM